MLEATCNHEIKLSLTLWVVVFLSWKHVVWGGSKWCLVPLYESLQVKDEGCVPFLAAAASPQSGNAGCPAGLVLFRTGQRATTQTCCCPLSVSRLRGACTFTCLGHPFSLALQEQALIKYPHLNKECFAPLNSVIILEQILKQLLFLQSSE